MSEPQSRLPHRLSVVWFSDLVGWSDLAGRDEDRAIALAVQVGQTRSSNPSVPIRVSTRSFTGSV